MDGLFLRGWLYQSSLPHHELEAVDQGELLDFAETSVAVGWADGLIPGLIDESN